MSHRRFFCLEEQGKLHLETICRIMKSKSEMGGIRMKALYMRIAAAMMAFCLCFSLAACGKEGTKEESSNPPYESSQSQAGTAEHSNSMGETALSPSDEPETALPVGGGDVAVAPASGTATENLQHPKRPVSLRRRRRPAQSR